MRRSGADKDGPLQVVTLIATSGCMSQQWVTNHLTNAPPRFDAAFTSAVQVRCCTSLHVTHRQSRLSRLLDAMLPQAEVQVATQGRVATPQGTDLLSSFLSQFDLATAAQVLRPGSLLMLMQPC